MIIVNQNKTEIINFDYGFSLNILTGTTKQVINIDGHKIGEYKTEERAKEILQEIIKKYEGRVLVNFKGLLSADAEKAMIRKYKDISNFSNVLVTDERKEIKYIPCENTVYYMPEE